MQRRATMFIRVITKTCANAGNFYSHIQFELDLIHTSACQDDRMIPAKLFTRVAPIVQKVTKLHLHIMASMKSCIHKDILD